MDRPAVTRCTKRTRLSTVSIMVYRQFPLFHYLWHQIQAMFFHLHALQLLQEVIQHLARTVWVQEDAESRCSELATGQPLL